MTAQPPDPAHGGAEYPDPQGFPDQQTASPWPGEAPDALWPGPDWVASQEIWPVAGPAGTGDGPSYGTAGQRQPGKDAAGNGYGGGYAGSGQGEPAAAQWPAQDPWGPQDPHTAHEDWQTESGPAAAGAYATGTQPAIPDSYATGTQAPVQDGPWPGTGQWAGPATGGGAWPAGEQWQPAAGWPAGQGPATGQGYTAQQPWPGSADWPAGPPPAAAGEAPPGTADAPQAWLAGGWGTGDSSWPAGPAPGIPATGPHPPGATGTGVPGPGGRSVSPPGGVPATGVPATGIPGQGPVPPAEQAARQSAVPTPAFDGDLRWAMLAYLTVPFFSFVVPLLACLATRQGSRPARTHAVQALNVALTILLYNVSATVLAAVLALDTPAVALSVAGPLAVALWLISLGYLIRAASAAGRGKGFSFPPWLCAALFR
jgi:uncharacterized Tic20 family protein